MRKVHIPRVWPAAMLDHPSYRAADNRAWVVLCPCSPYRPVITGDDLDAVNEAADNHGISQEEMTNELPCWDQQRPDPEA